MKTTLPTIRFQSYEIELHYKRPLLETMPLITNPGDAEIHLRAFIHPKRLDLKECF